MPHLKPVTPPVLPQRALKEFKTSQNLQMWLAQKVPEGNTSNSQPFGTNICDTLDEGSEVSNGAQQDTSFPPLQNAILVTTKKEKDGLQDESVAGSTTSCASDVLGLVCT